MARLSSVVVRRFKRLDEIEVPLDDITVLIGANNSGKSSVLQAVHFAVSIAQTARLIGEGVAWRNDAFELSFNPSELLYSPVADVHSLATGGRLQESRSSQIEIELRGSNGDNTTVGLRRGRNRNIGVSISGRALGEELMDLASPFTVYAPGLAGVPKEERYMSTGVIRRFVARGDANLTLRNVLRMLSSNRSSWDQFSTHMRTLFSGLSIEIDFDENTDENILANFGFDDGPRFPLDASGTSILQTSQILAYVLLFKPKVLILDEPDSHLHPDNQRALCTLIARLASEQSFQAIISTHSRHVLDALGSTTKLIWISKGHRVDQPDINTTEVLLDIGALDSVDYFANGQLKCVIATEDSDTDRIKPLLWSNGFVEEDTEIASYAGCSKSDAAIVLGRFLKDRAAHVELVVHRDRDYQESTQIERFKGILTDAGIRPLVTKFSDIEGYYLSPEHLHALNPCFSKEELAELIDQAIQETRNKSIEALINSRTESAHKARKTSGTSVNAGQIALSATQDYDAEPRIYCRGKSVIGRLKSLMHQKSGSVPVVFQPSQHLRDEELLAIAKDIWPT